MADSIYWTLFEKFTSNPGCAYSPEGIYARNLLKLNSNSQEVYMSLDQTQRARLKAGVGPATNSVLTSVTQAVSEMAICQAVKDKARKQAYNDSLIGTQIQIPESIDRNGDPKPSRWATFLEIGAIAAAFIAEVWNYAEQNPPVVVDANTALKNRMAQLGYEITSEVPSGWIFPDGIGVVMKDFTGGHQKMLYDMGIVATGGYTAFEVAYLLNKLIRKANYLTYSFGTFSDSNVLNGLKYQINHDYDAGHIKSADRMLIENVITNKVFAPTVQELLTDGISATLSRPMRDSAVWQ